MTKLILNVIILIFISTSIYADSFSFGNMNNTDVDNTILPPEEVFVPLIETVSKNHYKLVWEIKENYYMYKNKIDMDANFTILGEPEIIYDDNFEKEVPIYRYFMEIDIQTDKNDLNVQYQGCKDNSVCYLPKIKKFSLK